MHNHGPPIPSELVPVLFEPFRRGVPEDCSPRGLGLGLYIVQQIVLGHDGTIGVDSTAHDGTTFTLHLPRHHAAMTARAGLPTRLIASSPLPWKPLQAPSSIERPRHSGRGHARLST